MMTEKIDKLLELLTHEKHFRVRLFWEGIAVGIASGLSVGLFRWASGSGSGHVYMQLLLYVLHI